jgi:hypothetical protein
MVMPHHPIRIEHVPASTFWPAAHQPVHPRHHRSGKRIGNRGAQNLIYGGAAALVILVVLLISAVTGGDDTAADTSAMSNMQGGTGPAVSNPCAGSAPVVPLADWAPKATPQNQLVGVEVEDLRWCGAPPAAPGWNRATAAALAVLAALAASRTLRCTVDESSH